MQLTQLWRMEHAVLQDLPRTESLPFLVTHQYLVFGLKFSFQTIPLKIHGKMTDLFLSDLTCIGTVLIPVLRIEL